MKLSLTLVPTLMGLTDAYPGLIGRLEGVAKISAPKITARQTTIPPFDAAAQLVDVSGEYAFVAPTSTDQRGPCPGLNALANHGYLPHNGVATIDEFITATNTVFGMGIDLATFLAIYGAVFDGDLTEWSIGGPDSLISLGSLLGEPQGISGSHNKYEGDASPTRGDLYQYGNDYLLQLSQFEALYNLGQPADVYDLTLLTEYRYTRFQESIDNNPYFFNAPFSGVVAQPAAWSFIYRFMSNKSEEYPEGLLNGANLMSFYAVTQNSDGSFTYNPGYERIPENWYTRNAADEYTIPYLVLDSNAMLLEHPEFGSVGGNLGKTNTFFGLDPGNLTSDVYSASSLTEGNNLFCYGLELTVMETPDILEGLFADLDSALSQISSEFSSVTNSLGCPTLTNVNNGQFSQFPGYTASYDGYSAPDSSLL